MLQKHIRIPEYINLKKSFKFYEIILKAKTWIHIPNFQVSEFLSFDLMSCTLSLESSDYAPSKPLAFEFILGTPFQGYS